MQLKFCDIINLNDRIVYWQCVVTLPLNAAIATGRVFRTQSMVYDSTHSQRSYITQNV